MKLLLAFTLLWVTAGASPLGIEGRIYNGEDALPRQFPYMVYIETTIGSIMTHCGGALISSRWVLTAAHCVYSPNNARIINIYLGGTNRNDADIGYEVSSPTAVHIHPSFNTVVLNDDIALIEIPNTVSCSGIEPVPLPPLHLSPPRTYLGESGTVSGWGYTSDSSGLSLRLQWGHVRVTPSASCDDLNHWIVDTEMCIDTLIDSVSPCKGDSGGPFVLESTGELVGIISHGVGKSCEKGEPLVFTRVTHYLNWIRALTGISY